MAGGVQQFRCLEPQPGGRTPYLSLWSLLEELRLCRECRDTKHPWTHPLNFTHDGGEAIFNLPNGLQGYYLANASGLRLDEAPINIVSNPAASDPTVRNGISCIGCHTEGMKTFEDEVRAVIESNANPPYNKAQALRLYVEQSVMDDRVSEDMETYRAALAATGGTFGGVEPVSRFHEAFQGPIDAAYAAAVVGLQTETFLERVRENTGLQNVGLLALDNPNGSVKRDTWTSKLSRYNFRIGLPGTGGRAAGCDAAGCFTGWAGSYTRFQPARGHSRSARQKHKCRDYS